MSFFFLFFDIPLLSQPKQPNFHLLSLVKSQYPQCWKQSSNLLRLFVVITTLSPHSLSIDFVLHVAASCLSLFAQSCRPKILRLLCQILIPMPFHYFWNLLHLTKFFFSQLHSTLSIRSSVRSIPLYSSEITLLTYRSQIDLPPSFILFFFSFQFLHIASFLPSFLHASTFFFVRGNFYTSIIILSYPQFATYVLFVHVAT